MGILDGINSPKDVKKLTQAELSALAYEVRELIVSNTAHSGGHLASNLGAVEITIALHRVFDTSKDRIVFDVGHQCYTHKILTGRRERFETLRSLGGLGGFPDPCESEHDAFRAGHASTSVSAALGIARARTLKGKNFGVIALIGDGALTGGLAYEALIDAGQSREPMIVILNDNEMSIGKNAGGGERLLARMRLGKRYIRFKDVFRHATSKIPGGSAVYRFVHRSKNKLKDLLLRGNIFEDMGFTYLGPVDGHDIKNLTRFLEMAKNYNAPVLIHASTVKGKGYSFAEELPSEFHGTSGFDIKSGERVNGGRSFSSEFGAALADFAREDSRICAITAAMQSGTGLDRFAAEFPTRFFDVGIAEGHAATMSAGLASMGMLPVFAVYSTFLQRSYDMLIHDVALQRLRVVFAVDRAGLIGEDGATHQGVFDAAFLSQIPGMRVFCPANYAELRTMLRLALYDSEGPAAVRYPRGGEGCYTACSEGFSEVLKSGDSVTIAAYGTMINEALKAAGALALFGVNAEVLKLNTIAPLDIPAVLKSVSRTGALIVAEDCVNEGSVGMRLSSAILESGMCPAVRFLNLGDEFIPHGDVKSLMKIYNIDANAIVSAAVNVLGSSERGVVV